MYLRPSYCINIWSKLEKYKKLISWFELNYKPKFTEIAARVQSCIFFQVLKLASKSLTLLAFSNIESIDDALKVDQGF